MSMREQFAMTRLKELTPYMSDKEREKLVSEGRSETYVTSLRAWDAGSSAYKNQLDWSLQNERQYKNAFDKKCGEVEELKIACDGWVARAERAESKIADIRKKAMALRTGFVSPMEYVNFVERLLE